VASLGLTHLRTHLRPPSKTEAMDFGRGKGGEEERLKAAKTKVRQTNTKSKSEWMDAVERGEHKRVAQLLEAGQPINELGKWNGSPAHYVAARMNDGVLLKYLLDNGADPLITTDDNVSAGWISISKGYVKMLVILLSYYPKGTDVTELMDIARSRRDWRCVYELEQFTGATETSIPEAVYEIPSGWAMGEVPTGVGGKGPLKPFYWRTDKKDSCQDDPPDGSIKKHPLDGYLEGVAA